MNIMCNFHACFFRILIFFFAFYNGISTANSQSLKLLAAEPARNLNPSRTFLVSCSLTPSRLRREGMRSPDFKLFGVSDLVTVFEDGYKLPPVSDSVKLFGIGGEIISGQFAVHAEKNLTRVSVAVSNLKNELTGSNFPDDAISWNFVGSIPLKENTKNQPLNILARSAPAKFPEFLMPGKEIDISAKTWKAVWLTVKIPDSGLSGEYSGKITVRTGKEEHSLPLKLTIFRLDLPSERHLKIVEWYSTEGFERFHGIKEEYSPEWFGMLKKYADNMVEHRQNTFRVPMDAIEISRSASGKLEFDFKRFDQIARVFWETKKMDLLETGFLANFGEKDWFSTQVLLKDFPVADAVTGKQIRLKGEEVVPFLLPSFERHLRENGWLSKTLFHIRDEPSVHNALAWKEMSAYMHRFAPDLARMDAIETTFLLDDIEIACPKLDHFATWNESYKAWQEQGHELWFYTVGIYQGSRFPDKTIDMPLIDSRIMHWLNYTYDATGYLHWGWNQWNENPYADVGEHIGDAWHVYPVKDGVLNSLRWEQMRNGIQDYEYFWMLENKIKGLKDSLGRMFSWIEPKQRGKEIAGEVVKSFADHPDDPSVLYNAKMKVIKELLDFNTSPKIYIQTNPSENTVVTNHSSVEVFGWAEPGTRIIINGTEIPVTKDGLFLEQFGGDFIDPTKIHLGDRIKAEAKNSEGSKVITREFIIR
jgi:hypothetical protein